MPSPIDQLPQMIAMVEGIRNDRRRLEQQDMSLAQQAQQMTMQADAQKVQQGYTKVQTVAQLMEMAANLNKDLQSSAGDLIANNTLSDGTQLFNPDALGRIFAGNIPNSTRFEQQKSAARSNEREQSIHDQIMPYINNMPEGIARDAATNAFATSTSGMGAGASRQSAAMANPAMISDQQTQNSILTQMNLMLSPAQREQNSIARQGIAQGWAQLQDNRDFRAVGESIDVMQYLWTMEAKDAAAKGVQFDLPNPLELSKQITDITTAMAKTGLKPEAKAAYGVALTTVLTELGRVNGRLGNAPLASVLGSITPEMVMSVGPKGMLGMIGDMFEGVGKMNNKPDGTFGGWGSQVPQQTPQQGPQQGTQPKPPGPTSMAPNVPQPAAIQNPTPYQKAFMDAQRMMPRIVP